MREVIKIPEGIEGNGHQYLSLCGVSFNKKGELIAEYYHQYLNTNTGEVSDYKFGVKRFNKMPAHECDCGLSMDRCQH
jgi:hypothetical protein